MISITTHLWRFLRYVLPLFLVCLLASGCIFDSRLRQAKHDTEQMVQQLPVPAELTFLGQTKIHTDFSDIPRILRKYSDTCWYADFYRAYGTTLTEANALDAYSALLIQQGWQLIEQDEQNRHFEQGINYSIYLSTRPLPTFIRDMDPDNRRDDYPTVLILRLFSRWPQTKGC